MPPTVRAATSTTAITQRQNSGFDAQIVNRRALFIEKYMGLFTAHPLAFRIVPMSRLRSLNHVSTTLGSDTTRTSATSDIASLVAFMLETTAISDAIAAPTMPIPMPIAATLDAIAAPDAWALCALVSTTFSDAFCLSPKNFFTIPLTPSPSLRHGAQNASTSETWFSTTFVMTASQSFPSRS